MELQEKKPLAIAKNRGVEQIEAHMLNIEQANCPVTHRFGPNIYIREVLLPKGIIAIGHKQKYDHLNIMLTGKVAVINGDEVQILEAPLVFTGKAGRKIGYVLETCVWQNVYSTSETDIEKLENHFLDKSETFTANEKELKDFYRAKHQEQREDYYKFLESYGFDKDEVRKQSENKEDQVPMPAGWDAMVSVRDSFIEGKGLFISFPVAKGSIICPARVQGMRTPAGRYTNHSKDPNCEFVIMENGDIYLFAIRDIKGCRGGDHGEELTVDYRQALSLAGIKELKCQE